MNWYCKRRLLILALIMCVTGPSFATDDCAICEEEEDPTLVNAGWPRCKSKKAGTAIAGQDCKECDGSGNIRNKPDGPIAGNPCQRCENGQVVNEPAGTAISGEDCKECDGNGGERNKPAGTSIPGEKCKECDNNGIVREKQDGDQDANGVTGRCCGGVWYAKDFAKEGSDCWEWDSTSCVYVCTDSDDPRITVNSPIIVYLKCADSKAGIPDVGATATDNCEVMTISQSPGPGSGQYGDGDSATVTVIATDNCEGSDTVTVAITFVYDCNIDALIKAQGEVISKLILYRDGCIITDEIVARMRDIYAEIVDISEGYDPPLWSPEPGALLGLELLKLIERLISELDQLCNQLKELCGKLDSLEQEIYDAYLEYVKIYSDLECWNRCRSPLPPPGPISCEPCGKSSDCHLFDINF